MTERKTSAKTKADDEPAVPESSDAAHWGYQESTQEWPAEDGPHVEQVYEGIPASESKD